MSVLVKICGLGDEPSVTAAVEAGADAVGFVFYEKSVRNMTPAGAAKISAGVPAGVKRVAVMLHPAAQLWEEVRQVFQPDVLQTDSEDFAVLDVDDGIEKWPVFREGAVPAGVLPGTFIYEGKQSGFGETVNWDVAADIARRGEMVLAGGLSADNIAEAIGKVRPFGVDVSSAVESAPGKKDPQKIAAFVAAAKAAVGNQTRKR